MNLALTEEQELLRGTFASLLAAESSPERARRAEEPGFDDDLWARLAEIGAFGIRVPGEHGGSALGTLEATILLHEAGRRLATGPIAESVVACRLLAELGDAALLVRALSGDTVLSLAVRPLEESEDVLIAGGSRATAALARRGNEVVLLQGPAEACAVRNLGAPGLAQSEVVTAPVAHAEGFDLSKYPAIDQGKPVRRVIRQTVAACLGLEQQGKCRVALDVDPLDRIHLHGDFQAHGDL